MLSHREHKRKIATASTTSSRSRPSSYSSFSAWFLIVIVWMLATTTSSVLCIEITGDPNRGLQGWSHGSDRSSIEGISEPKLLISRSSRFRLSSASSAPSSSIGHNVEPVAGTAPVPIWARQLNDRQTIGGIKMMVCQSIDSQGSCAVIACKRGQCCDIPLNVQGLFQSNSQSGPAFTFGPTDDGITSCGLFRNPNCNGGSVTSETAALGFTRVTNLAIGWAPMSVRCDPRFQLSTNFRD